MMPLGGFWGQLAQVRGSKLDVGPAGAGPAVASRCCPASTSARMVCACRVDEFNQRTLAFLQRHSG